MKKCLMYLFSLLSRMWSEESKVKVIGVYGPGEHRDGWIATMAGNPPLPPGTRLPRF
jgi:hypothetical protein